MEHLTARLQSALPKFIALWNIWDIVYYGMINVDICWNVSGFFVFFFFLFVCILFVFFINFYYYMFFYLFYQL